ncbi:MAG: hypothetical protein R3E56_20840 [Burkholderiaceae bacterium]|jgi:hypothetical protein
MIKFAGMTLAALMVVGCATTDKPFWAKPNVSADDTYTELSDCRFKVGVSKIEEDEQELMVAHCMRGKGFRLLANQS